MDDADDAVVGGGDYADYDGFAIVPGFVFVDDGGGCNHSHCLLLFVRGWILTNALHRMYVDYDPGIVLVLTFHSHARIEVDCEYVPVLVLALLVHFHQWAWECSSPPSSPPTPQSDSPSDSRHAPRSNSHRTILSGAVSQMAFVWDLWRVERMDGWCWRRRALRLMRAVDLW